MNKREQRGIGLGEEAYSLSSTDIITVTIIIIVVVDVVVVFIYRRLSCRTVMIAKSTAEVKRTGLQPLVS